MDNHLSDLEENFHSFSSQIDASKLSFYEEDYVSYVPYDAAPLPTKKVEGFHSAMVSCKYIIQEVCI